jgi:ubiquinol-cytochrome c reductase cytochrome b subunit
MTTTEEPGAAPSAPPSGRPDWIAWLERRVKLTELFSFVSHFGIVYTPVNTERPLREELQRLGRTPILSYARWPHVLGLWIGLLFLLEAVSGVLLAFYYHPTAAEAHESTRSIVRDVPLGWMVHQIHAWGAYLLVAIVLVRLLRLFRDRLYQAPRELVWMCAVALAWIVLQLDFTGRLLPWDLHAYWSGVRGMEVVWRVPLVGPVLSFLLGGRTVSEDVLTRFYVLHILLLPLLYLGFTYVTFASMRRVGLSRGPGADPPLTTFRRHTVDLIILTLLMFAGLVTLATMLPFPLQAAADPYATPRGTRPPWYMLAPYVLFQRLPVPAWIPGLLVLAAALAVLLLPAIVARAGQRLDDRRVQMGGIVVIAGWLALTVLGLFVDRR